MLLNALKPKLKVLFIVMIVLSIIGGFGLSIYVDSPEVMFGGFGSALLFAFLFWATFAFIKRYDLDDNLWHFAVPFINILAERIGEEQYAWIQSMVADLTTVRPIYLKMGAPIVELPKQCLLVVHSGKLSEVKQLVRFAEKIAETENIDKNIVIIGQEKGISDVFSYQCHDLIDAHHLFETAFAVFSGAGYNTMHQMSETKVNHFVIPFARPLDDQFLRVKMFGNLWPSIRKV